MRRRTACLALEPLLASRTGGRMKSTPIEWVLAASLVVSGCSQGAQGPKGESGPAGESVTVTPLGTGTTCTYGGAQFSDGITTGRACNGAPGERGLQGLQGLQGVQGDQGIQGPPGPVSHLYLHDLGYPQLLGPVVSFTSDAASWLATGLVWEYDRASRRMRHYGTVDRVIDGSNSLAPSRYWGLAFSYSDAPTVVVACNVVHYTCSGCDAGAWCITGPVGVSWPDPHHQLRVVVN